MTTMLTGFDIASTLPFAIASGFGIVVLMLEVFQRPSFSRGYMSYVTAFGFAVTAVAALGLRKLGGHEVFGGMSFLDGYAQTFTVLFCVAGAGSALVAPAWLSDQRIDRGEYYALLLFAVAGMIMMVSAGDFAVFFVGLEIQSVAVYALASYLRSSPRSAEAGMKYFITGAFASALLVYGIALIYGATGSTNFVEIGQALSGIAAGGGSSPLLAATAHDALLATAGGFDASVSALATNFGDMRADLPLASIGVLLILAAFAVKIAAVPFHMWAPDAYTGSPTPVVGFLAAGVKIAGFAALIRILALAFFGEDVRMGVTGWVPILYWISLISMVLGNLVAIVQTNVKRMLAYSSVAHAGYLLVAVVAMGYGAGNVDLASGVVFYGFAYTFGTVGAFGALAYLGRKGIAAENYDDLNGVGFKYPWLGGALAVFMLSSAGIPPAAGFIGKFLVFKGAIAAAVDGAARGLPGDGMLITLVVVGVVTSVAGVYYYLRVVVHLFMKKPLRAVGSVAHSGAKFAIVVFALLTLWFGIFPGKLAQLSEDGVGQMSGRADAVYVDTDR